MTGDAMDPLIGTTVLRYRLERVLGAGSQYKSFRDDC